MPEGTPAPAPLCPADRLDLLPRVAVALALGSKSDRSGPLVRVAFEDAGYAMHPEDFALAQKVAGRIRPFMKGSSRPALLDAHDHARKCLSEELFRPGAVRVIYYPSVVKATAFYRCVLPVLELAQRGEVVAHLKRGAAREALDYDIAVIQLDHSKASLQFARALQSMGKKVVFELDDALESLEPWHDRRLDPGEQGLWRDMISNADAVLVTTEDLRARYEKIAKRIEVFPNCLKLSQWPRTKPHGAEEFRILWAGSPTHTGDLEVVSRAIERLCREVPHARVIFFGMAPEHLRVKSSQIETLPFCDFEEYPIRLADVRADVAIAPLSPVPFNLGKCVSPSTLISTKAGIKTIGECVPHRIHNSVFPISETVFSVGGMKEATASYYHAATATLRIKTKLGYEIEGTPDHRILGKDGKWIPT